MKQEEIFEKLCYHDPRYPDYCKEHDDLDRSGLIGEENICYCDNCFYGRTKMAKYILHLESLID